MISKLMYERTLWKGSILVINLNVELALHWLRYYKAGTRVVLTETLFYLSATNRVPSFLVSSLLYCRIMCGFSKRVAFNYIFRRLEVKRGEAVWKSRFLINHWHYTVPLCGSLWNYNVFSCIEFCSFSPMTYSPTAPIMSQASAN